MSRLLGRKVDFLESEVCIRPTKKRGIVKKSNRVLADV